jgi:hypothetical protein
MSIWELLLIIAAIGAAGGVANALTSDNGFVLPKRDTPPTSERPLPRALSRSP